MMLSNVFEVNFLLLCGSNFRLILGYLQMPHCVFTTKFRCFVERTQLCSFCFSSCFTRCGSSLFRLFPSCHFRCCIGF